ncbi:sensor histidine kinase [Bacteroidales bacterium OttesenSCG-928-L14]|nr:sensor histidine kinase [Bacteroidales bacterium OttesenSCG-928-L14]
MKTFNTFLISLALIILPNSFNAQEVDYKDHRNRGIDSLELLLEQNNSLTTDELVSIYTDLAWGYNEINPNISKKYIEKTLEIIDESDIINIAYSYMRLAICYNDLIKPDSAIFYYNKSLEFFEKMKDDKRYSETQYYSGLSSVYGNLANVYNKMDQDQEALKYYLKAMEIFEKYDVKQGLFLAYSNIGEMHKAIGNYEQSLYYHLKSQDIANELNDPLWIAVANERLSKVYLLYYKDYEKALEHATLAYDYFMDHEEEGMEQISVLNSLAAIYYDGYDDMDKVMEYVNKALELYKKYNFAYEKSHTLRLLTGVYMKRGEWQKAEQTALETLALGDTESSNITSIYKYLAKIYAYLGKPEKSAEYIDEFSIRQNKIANLEYMSSISEMEVKYETEKKDLQIAALAKEKQLFLILMIVGGALILLILAILLYRNRLHRKQKQLIAAQVALESETAERSRLAKDLHDGLGGMLSLVKINLNDMKGKKIMEQDDAEHFSKAIDMLDNSISELRRVAHHIMPESLIRDGLKTSLEDFIEAVPNAEFHFFGKEKRLENNLEVILYRSAHELVNNALKYSSAEHINVQLVQETDRISLTVADNGNGFDIKQETKGSGLKNIKSRIAVYNGEMHIFSDNKTGTEINIEIPLS